MSTTQYFTQRSPPKEMDMHARNEYMDTLPGAFNLPRAIMLRQRYLHAASRPEKSRILDEYCANTGQNRKYAIRKIRPGVLPGKKERKKRKPLYDGQVVAALACVWEIFDYPCG